MRIVWTARAFGKRTTINLSAERNLPSGSGLDRPAPHEHQSWLVLCMQPPESAESEISRPSGGDPTILKRR